MSSSDMVRRSLRSAPAQNALSPAPVSTIARTQCSLRRARTAARSSLTSVRESAFIAAGRFRVTQAASARRSTMTLSARRSPLISVGMSCLDAKGSPRHAQAWWCDAPDPFRLCRIPERPPKCFPSRERFI